jgi:replication factor C subunit 2/4
MEICEFEKVTGHAPFLRADRARQVKYNDEGLEALLFTSEGDMRQAINNLQSTWSGFGFVSREAVFKVCDQPHPHVVQDMIKACARGEIQVAMDRLDELWQQGYAAIDIVTTIFRVTRGMTELPEYLKLEFIRVRDYPSFCLCD